MIATEHGQSVEDFHRSAGETLERLDRTGQAETLTVDGQPRAVILSPAVYDRLAEAYLLSQDVEAIRRSDRQIAEGNLMEAGAFFGRLREKLLAMKAAQGSAAAATE